jgi:hypothetical protein
LPHKHAYQTRNNRPATLLSEVKPLIKAAFLSKALQEKLLELLQTTKIKGKRP